MFSVNLAGRSRENLIAAGLALVCFLFYLSFLVRFGVMFFWGSDLVANAAYGVTLFTDIHQAGWTVPKPAEMLIFGSLCGLTGDLWFMQLALIVATSLTVWAGCRLIQKHGAGPIGCIAFCVLMMTLPRMFGTTLEGGAGGLNVLFLLLAVFAATRIEERPYRVLLLVALSLANLSRPDSWPCTYLIIFGLLSLRCFDEQRIRFTPWDAWFLIPMAMPLVWLLVNWLAFEDPLYSMSVVRSFFAEAVRKPDMLGGSEHSRLSRFFPKLDLSLRDLLCVSRWGSPRMVTFSLLVLIGIGSLWRKARRVLLLLACLMVGTLMFYFVYALRGALFVPAYIYTILVCVTLLAAIGVGAVAGLARSLHSAWGRWTIQVGVLGAVMLVLTVSPVRRVIAQDLIPKLRGNSIIARRVRPAIKQLVDDVRQHASPDGPVILSTRGVPPSWISLALGSGKDVHLAERLLRQDGLEGEKALPALEGRTVYFCVRAAEPERTRGFLQPMIDRGTSCEVVYQEQGLVIVRCAY